jgi:hypothetical protein
VRLAVGPPGVLVELGVLVRVAVRVIGVLVIVRVGVTVALGLPALVQVTLTGLDWPPEPTTELGLRLSTAV